MRAPELLGGRYEIRGVLGRGGMAEVRDGWDTRLGRPVAIKIMHPVFDARPETRRRFEAEARAAASLSNAHIVAVHDSGEHDGMPFFVMERLTGESLADKIACGPLPQPLVRSVLDGVLSALAVAHAGDILHRDIKPGNVLFTHSGEVKVSDFGIAKTAQSNFTAAGEIFGTMAYLSPDRVLGRPATAADDVYAVGVVGYEALTGRPPFVGENIAALAQAILHAIPPPIAALRPDVDPALAAVCERAMARDPATRFQSAAAMRAALAGRAPVPHSTRVLDAPVPPPISVAPLSSLSRPNRRNKLLALGGVAAAIVLAVIFLAFDSTRSSPPTEPVTTSTTMPAPPPPPSTTTPSTVASTVVEEPKKPPGPPGRKPGKHWPRLWQR